ncbi:hypothetical protein KAX35_00690 [candidate division WOR-3 bacterium]|nr:hypothetical protein [candidate division WOR-3 bacterium]
MRKIISIVIIVALLSGGLYSSEEQEAKKPKSEKTAIALSFGATVVPFIGVWAFPPPATRFLCVLGLTAGPSMGHFYARQWKRGLVTTGIRAVLVAGGVALFEHWYNAGLSGETNEAEIYLVALTLIGIIGSALYDMGTAYSSVRKYNESIKKSNVYLVPKIDMEKESYGVSLVHCF